MSSIRTTGRDHFARRHVTRRELPHYEAPFADVPSGATGWIMGALAVLCVGAVYLCAVVLP